MPVPAFGSFGEGTQPSELACREEKVSSCVWLGKRIAYDSIDEFDVSWALRVAVTGSVFGTGFVGGKPRRATIGVHL